MFKCCHSRAPSAKNLRADAVVLQRASNDALADTVRSSAGPVPGARDQLVGGLRRLEVPVDRRRTHRQQFRAHRGTVPFHAVGELTMTFQPVELGPHRRGQYSPHCPPTPSAAPAACRSSTSTPGGLRSFVATCHPRPRRPLYGSDEPAPGVVMRPAGHRHHLVEDPTLSFSLALPYALAYLVTSARHVIDSPLPMPHERHCFADIPN